MADGVGKKGAGKSAAKPARKKGGAGVNINESGVGKTPSKKTNQELRDFKLIIDSSPIIIFYKDLEGKFLRVNRTFAEALNMSTDEFIGKTNFDLYSLPMAQAMKEDDQEVIKSGRPKLNIVEQYESASGTRWVQTDKIPILDESGAVTGLLGFAQDITERKIAEQSLFLSEERYRTLVEKAFEGIIVIQDGNIIFANPRAYEIIDYPRDRIEPRPFMDFIHTEDRDKVLDRHLRRLKGEKLDEVYPIRLIDRNGNVKWAQISTTLIDWGGKPATLTFLADISERKRAEEALMESEKRVKVKLDAILSPHVDVGKLELKDILDIQAIQAIMDDFYKLTSVSAWILDLKGNILISTGWQDICTQFHRANPETCKNCIESDTQLSEGVAPGTFKVYKCKNNMWDLVTPITVEGKHIGNLFLGQFLYDDETTDRELFRSQARRYGFNEAEYLAAIERVPRWSRQTVKTSMDFYSKFAHMISTLSHSNIALARSLTEKNNLLTALQASEAQYRLLAEHTTDFIVLMDMNLNPTYQSPSAEKHTGLTHKELMELPMEKRIAPESLRVASEMFLEEIPKIIADPNYNPIRTLELQIYRADGTTLWSENTFSVIRDENRNPISILGEARDITKRREAEKQLAQTLSALEKTLADTVIAISKMVEMKDPFTAGHQIRVAQLAIAIANKLKLTDEQIALINTAATIHDIGKIYVPSDILSKPGKLSALEYEIIQTHVRGSYEILKEIDFIGPIAQIVFQHHERMDGSGYPRALKGPDILPEAKILIVADVVEAMSSHRPYRAAMGIEKALEEISRNRGKLYDEAAVDACLELFLNNEFSFKSV